MWEMGMNFHWDAVVWHLWLLQSCNLFSLLLKEFGLCFVHFSCLSVRGNDLTVWLQKQLCCCVSCCDSQSSGRKTPELLTILAYFLGRMTC